MSFTDNWLLILSSLALGLLTLSYIYVSWKYNYWKRLGINQLKPSFPFGNVGDLVHFRKHIGATYIDLYNQMGDQRYAGIYHFLTPCLLLKDPEMVKTFLIKDFTSFHDRGFFMDEKNDPLSVRLFNLPGQRWKSVRNQLTPAFSSGRLKQMFETIADCTKQLEPCVLKMIEGGRPLEMKEVAARFTTDVIASCAFGVTCNCLENPDAEFRRKGRELLKPGYLAGAIVLGFIAPWLYDIVNFAKMPKSLEAFFRGLVADTMAHREKNNVVRHDVLQSMITLVKDGYKVENESSETTHKEKITFDQLAAQTFGFYVAGFETSSSTISFCLFELSKQEDIQERLYEEIIRVLAKHGGKLTYDGVMEMQYLDMVFSETLRKYPTVSILNRMCTIPYKIPDTDVTLPAGTFVVVPTQALHHDPKHYPDPQRFDPERFSEEAVNARPRYAYLPFGEGPRSCVGMRFGLIQTKVALVALLRDFHFKKSAITPEVLKYEPTVFFMFTTTGIHLDVTRRKPVQF